MDRSTKIRFGILVAAFALAGISMQFRPEAPVEVPIRELWRAPETWQGRRVLVRGTLKLFLEGKPRAHFAVESAEKFRVGVRGVKRDRLRALLGRTIVLSGILGHNSGGGTYIEADRIGVLKTSK